MAVLKKGSKGKPVTQLQKAYNTKGAKPKMEVDGVFGAVTEASLVLFQKKNGLKPDGIAGEKTLWALGIGKRPKSASWPHGEMDVFYGRVMEARKFNSNKIKDAINFLQEAQKDTESLKKNLAERENMLKKYEGDLQGIFKTHIKTFNELKALRVYCEKSSHAADIAKAQAKAGGILKKWRDPVHAYENYWDTLERVSMAFKDIKAYSLGLRAIKNRWGR